MKLRVLTCHANCCDGRRIRSGRKTISPVARRGTKAAPHELRKRAATLTSRPVTPVTLRHGVATEMRSPAACVLSMRPFAQSTTTLVSSATRSSGQRPRSSNEGPRSCGQRPCRAVKDRIRTVNDRLRAVYDRVRAVSDRLRTVKDRIRAVDDRIRAVNDRVRAVDDRVSGKIYRNGQTTQPSPAVEKSRG